MVGSLRWKVLFALMLAPVVCGLAFSESGKPSSGSYLFVWGGDAEHKANDFLMVVDADSGSPNYGKLVTTLPTDQKTVRPHHTEYTMPASGMLFANDHDPGRTFIFDLRDPLHPKTVTSFYDRGGFMHPHSYLRLPNGHVLATFQHKAPSMAEAMAHPASHDQAMLTVETYGEPADSLSGGLVEMDDQGNVVRAAGNFDSAFAGADLMPYGVVILPEIDRALVTNTSMQESDFFGVTYQIWRLSDLKLLHTAYLDPGSNHYSQIGPEEPRRGPDGSVYVQTLGCGIERITGIAGDNPSSKLVYVFPGQWCGVPTIVGHFLVQSVPAIHGLIVINLTKPDQPVEVSRLVLGEDYPAHWTGWGEKTQRLVATGQSGRVYLLKLDQATGKLSFDEAFKGLDGKVGFSLNQREWPHGWTGTVYAHGAVFSR